MCISTIITAPHIMNAQLVFDCHCSINVWKQQRNERRRTHLNRFSYSMQYTQNAFHPIERSSKSIAWFEPSRVNQKENIYCIYIDTFVILSIYIVYNELFVYVPLFEYDEHLTLNHFTVACRLATVYCLDNFTYFGRFHWDMMYV